MNNTIISQLAEVREDGRTNMLDRHGVIRVAIDLELEELHEFVVTANSEEYVAALREMGRRR